jgi:two-component system, OmpR family, alkaline phosphatase synthesis response regulator PhoP
MTETAKRILIVEDEPHIAEGLRLNLELQGYEVALAEDGVEGLRLWRDWRPDLIVLDIMLPIMDGLSVLRHIRLRDERLPILILSAKGEADDRVKGLSYGVDDYLTKPFHLEEFLLRVERLLTRSRWSGNGDSATKSGIFRFGENAVDLGTGEARHEEETFQLTEQELRLVQLFIANEGTPLTRSRILEIGWGYTRATATRTVDNFIVRLRRYFERDPKRPSFFRSIRSVGYLFDSDGGEKDDS